MRLPSDAALRAEGAADAPAVQAVDGIFARAIAAHASDIHIEPDQRGGCVRLRVDGLLHETRDDTR